MTDHKLRFNWTVPAPVILAILAQAAGLAFIIGVWKTSIESNIELYRQDATQRATVIEGRLAILEKGSAQNVALIERVKGVEVNVEVLKEQGQNIEQKIDKLIDRAGRK